MARPSDYSEKIIAKSWEYLDRYQDLEQVVPTIEGLADYINVTRTTIYDWAKDPEKLEFSYIYEALMRKQGLRLVNGGLDNKFNSAIAGMILSKHGYVKVTETHNTNTNKNTNIDLTKADDETLAKLEKLGADSED